MFTGLVRTVGRIRRQPQGVHVVTGDGLDPPALGDSIAVDGLCLTVARLTADGFQADVSEETLARSTLAGKALRGSEVNLEPALRLSDRLGGHLVSGHVDGTGEVLAVRELDRSWRLELAWHDPSYGRYVCDKASVAVDGVSLTVAGTGLAGSRFWVAVIPHTWSGTTLCRRRPGDPVNLEADLMAKYTERLLDRTAAAAPPAGPTAAAVSPDAGWLAEHGWG